MNRSVRVTLLLYFFSEVFARSIPFLLTPYFSRELGTEGFGQLSLYLGNVVLFGALFSLSFDIICAQYVYKKGVTRTNYLVYISQLYYMMLFALSSVLSLLFPSPFTLALTSSILLASYMVFIGQYQAKRYVIKYVSSQISFSVLFLISVVILIDFNVSYTSIAISQIVSYLCVLGFISNKVRYRLSLATSRRYFRYILSFGGPLILHKTAVFLRDGMERYLIYSFYTASILGVYFSSKQLALIVLVLVTIINRATSPFLMRSIKSGRVKVKHFYMTQVAVLSVCVLSYIISYFIFNEYLMSTIFGKEYAGAYVYVPQMVFGATLYMSYTFSVNFLYYFKEIKALSSITFFVSVCHVLYVYYFMTIDDLIMVSYATIFSNGAISFLVFMKTRKILKKEEAHELL